MYIYNGKHIMCSAAPSALMYISFYIISKVCKEINKKIFSIMSVMQKFNLIIVVFGSLTHSLWMKNCSCKRKRKSNGRMEN